MILNFYQKKMAMFSSMGCLRKKGFTKSTWCHSGKLMQIVLETTAKKKKKLKLKFVSIFKNTSLSLLVKVIKGHCVKS